MSDTAQYVPAGEVAVLVRAALKRAFPGVKFSVRQERLTYHRGIAVSFDCDGADKSAVWRVINQYAGSEWDAMRDCVVWFDSWLLPDGSARPAEAPEPEPPCEGARLVQFGILSISVHDRGFRV